jgi:hypothetical protein
VRERWKGYGEEVGGCIRQPVADALWELSDRFDVGVWHKCKNAGTPNVYDVFCGVIVNSVRLGQPHCRTVEECAERIIEDYKREVEKMKEPPAPPPDVAEELLREWSVSLAWSGLRRRDWWRSPEHCADIRGWWRWQGATR